MAKPMLLREARQPRQLLRMGVALLTGIAGAAAGTLAGMPLPFLLGPLVACAALTILGGPAAPLPYGRELGQAVVGLSIGLRFAPAVLATALKLLPMMALATVLIIASTMVAAIVLRKLGGVERRTAFFATAAAGLAEMAVVAHQKGADSDTVAVAHLVRVTTIVTTVPFMVTYFGTAGAIHPAPIALQGEAAALLLLFALSVAAAYAVQRFRFPNTWLLIPAALGALVAGAGFGPFAVPKTLLTVAQVVIGIWLGCRFRRELLARLPRVTAAAFATTALLLAVSAVIAFALSIAAGLPFVTSLLAVSPAGITEMALTASAMHLDATTVTAFQIMRIAVVMMTILPAFRAFEALSRRLDPART